MGLGQDKKQRVKVGVGQRSMAQVQDDHGSVLDMS